MYLEILTPEATVYQGEVTLISLPGSLEKGSFEILNGHAPMLSSLIAGKIRIKHDQGEESFDLKSGFIEVQENKVSILVEGMMD